MSYLGQVGLKQPPPLTALIQAVSPRTPRHLSGGVTSDSSLLQPTSASLDLSPSTCRWTKDLTRKG